MQTHPNLLKQKLEFEAKSKNTVTASRFRWLSLLVCGSLAFANSSKASQLNVVSLFEKAPLVAIGETGHETTLGLDVLIQAVQQIKEHRLDSVSFLYIEGSSALRELYRDLSTSSAPLAAALQKKEEMVEMLYCNSQYTYLLNMVFPVIRDLNQDRDARKIPPLTVIPIDAASELSGTKEMYFWRLDDENTKFSSDCTPNKSEFDSESLLYFYLSSYDRERDTAENFRDIHFRKNQNPSALIFYHQMHLSRSTQACMPKKVGNNKFIVEVSPSNWMQIAQVTQPFPVHVVALDHPQIRNPEKSYQTCDGAHGVRNPSCGEGVHWRSRDIPPKVFFDSILTVNPSEVQWLPDYPQFPLNPETKEKIDCSNYASVKAHPDMETEKKLDKK